MLQQPAEVVEEAWKGCNEWLLVGKEKQKKYKKRQLV